MLILIIFRCFIDHQHCVQECNMKTFLLLLFLIAGQQTLAFEIRSTTFAKQPSMAGNYSIGDLNGDGYNDLYTSGLSAYWDPGCTGCTTKVYSIESKILINNKVGGFNEVTMPSSLQVQGTQITRTANWCYFLSSVETSLLNTTIADIDNDGDNDIISSSGQILINDGMVNFELLSSLYPNSQYPVYTIDIDNDGVLEILNGGKIYKRNSLSPLSYIALSDILFDYFKKIELIDFNLDGFVDILTYDEDEAIIWFNDGAGNYPDNLKNNLGIQQSSKLVIGDFDNDLDPDIILSDKRILLNQGIGSGNFEALDLEFHMALSYDPMRIDSFEFIAEKLIDFNNDQFPDLLVTLKSDSHYSYQYILENNGSLGFSDKFSLINISREITNPEKSFSTIIADFNADEVNDFILIGFGDPFPECMYTDEQQHLGSSIFQRNMNPLVFANNINLYLTKPLEQSMPSQLYPTDFTRIPFSQSSLVDIDNDGKQEVLFSGYYNKYDPRSRSNLPIDDIFYVNIDDTSKSFSGRIEIPKGGAFITDYNNYLNNNTKRADFNGDGLSDYINHNQIYINRGAENIEAFPIELSFPAHSNNKLNVLDINGDGFADVVYIGKNSEPYILYGQPDMISLTPVKVFSIDAEQISMYDYNQDGMLDMYVLNKSKEMIKLKNIDGRFVKQSSHAVNNIDLPNFAVVDLNNDGMEEVLSYSFVDAVNPPNGSIKQPHPVSTLYIYQNYISEQYFTEIYRDEDIDLFNSDYLFYDFDKDLKTDVFIGGKIIYARDLPFFKGLHYDPSHNGHGFSIEEVGEESQFYTVFYSYDSSGYPQWFSDLGMFDQFSVNWLIGNNSESSIGYLYDYQSQTASLDPNSNVYGNLSHSQCGEVYGSLNLNYEIGQGPLFTTIEQDSWCSKTIVSNHLRSNTMLSGLWWAGPQDSGWGWSISLIERDETTDMVDRTTNWI